MTEAERIMNDRPIVQVSNDPRDPSVLTPRMLLLMKTNPSIPIGSFKIPTGSVKIATGSVKIPTGSLKIPQVL